MSFSKIILRNTLSNWAGMIFNTLVVVFLTPYILKHLGAERYGIYSLVFSIMHYLVLMELGIRGAVARYASKYVQSGDLVSLNGVISVAFLVGTCLGVFSIPLAFFLGKGAIVFFKISPDLRVETIYLFLAFGLNLGFSLLSYSFSGVLIGSQRYDLVNLRVILVAMLNAGLVVLFFSNSWKSLLSLAAAMVLSSSAGLFFLYGCAKWLHPGLSIGTRFLQPHIWKEMFHFGIWNLLIQVSTLVNSSANQIIIGRYLGAAVVPLYSIPYQLIVRLQSIVSGMTSTLMPVASNTLNTGDKKLLAHMLRKGTYLSSVLIFPVAGCLMVMARALFRVWLPEDYLFSWIVFVLMLASHLMAFTQTTSYYLLLGGGEIRGISIVYLLGSITMIVLSLLSVAAWKWGLFGVTFSLAAVQVLVNGVFQSWYMAQQVKIAYLEYLWKSYKMPLVCTIPSLILSGVLVYFFPPANLVWWGVEYSVSLIPFLFFGLLGLDDLPVIAPLQRRVRSLLHPKQTIEKTGLFQ
jgi:O-antigen/teichoic acid export membrane protein